MKNFWLFLGVFYFASLALSKSDPTQPPTISPDCALALGSVQSNPEILLKVGDAWGKPSGVFQGTFTSLGDWFACKEMVDSGIDYAVVDGALVLMTVQPPIVFPSNLGVCMPKSCLNVADMQFVMMAIINTLKGSLPGGRGDDNDIQGVISDIGSPLRGQLNQVARFHNVSYHTGTFFEEGEPQPPLLVYQVVKVNRPLEEEWSGGSVTIMSLFGALLAVVVVSTIADYQYQNQRLASTASDEQESLLPSSSTDKVNDDNNGSAAIYDDVSIRWFTFFSLFKSLRSLFHVEMKRHKELAILNFIRVFSILWIMFSHTILFSSFLVPVDFLNLLQETKKLPFTGILNGFLSVDSFYFMSTFLVAYMTFVNPHASQKFHYGKYIILRYLRVTPIYATLLAFYSLVFPLMGGGPLWTAGPPISSEACSKYWWTNLLYINNFYPEDLGDTCMNWSWYLATDFQLYLLIPLFTLPLALSKYRKWAPYIFAAGIVGSLALTIPLNIVYDIKDLLINGDIGEFQKNAETWLTKFYFKPYFRFFLMIVSIYGAYWTSSQRKKYVENCDSGMMASSAKLWMSQLVRAIGVALLLTIIYLPYSEIHGDASWSTTANTFYNVFSRPLWAIGMLMFIYPSIVYHEQTNPIIDSFFTWKGWAIGARLTFCVYLVHVMIQYLILYSGTRSVPFTWFRMLTVFGGTSLWSFVVSIPLYLFVEVPSGQLIKYLMGKK